MPNLIKKLVTVSNYYGIVTENKLGCFGCGAFTMYPVGRRDSNSKTSELFLRYFEERY